jgi:hypothetical protein
MQTLVPVGNFEEKARGLLEDAGFEVMLEYLARNPKAGDLIKGTGGLRKVRIARRSGGKRGGARVIYYYHNEKFPLLLLMIYAKADQEGLTANQAKRLKKWVDEIIDGLT